MRLLPQTGTSTLKGRTNDPSGNIRFFHSFHFFLPFQSVRRVRQPSAFRVSDPLPILFEVANRTRPTDAGTTDKAALLAPTPRS